MFKSIYLKFILFFIFIYYFLFFPSINFIHLSGLPMHAISDLIRDENMNSQLCHPFCLKLFGLEKNGSDSMCLILAVQTLQTWWNQELILAVETLQTWWNQEVAPLRQWYQQLAPQVDHSERLHQV